MRRQRRTRTKHKYNKYGKKGLKLGGEVKFDSSNNTISIDDVEYAAEKLPDNTIVVQDQRFQVGDLVQVQNETHRIANVVREPIKTSNVLPLSAWRYKFEDGSWQRDMFLKDPMRLLDIENKEHSIAVAYLESIGEHSLVNRVRNLRNK